MKILTIIVLSTTLVACSVTSEHQVKKQSPIINSQPTPSEPEGQQGIDNAVTIGVVDRPDLDFTEVKIQQPELASPQLVTRKNTYSLTTHLKSVITRLGEEGVADDELARLSQQVERFIKIFQRQKHEWFQGALFRSQKYIPMIQQEFAKANIPKEMAYLAMIESAFLCHAKSHVGAGGMWQFMPQTAKEYGLTVNRKSDERKDPLKSTQAAREYLLDRAAVYGADSFLFVTASYNAGEGRVSRALRKIDDPFAKRTFSHVSQYLPKETRNYVPQLLATIIIAEQPARYGFKRERPSEYVYIQLKKRYRLATLAKILKLEKRSIQRFNDDLASQTWTPAANYVLKVPRLNAPEVGANILAVVWQYRSKTQGQAFVTKIEFDQLQSQPHRRKNIASLPAAGKPDKRKILKTKRRLEYKAPISTGKYVNYTVQRGNRLADIAKWFKTDIKQLMAWNSITSTRLAVGQIIKIYGLSYSQQKQQHKIKNGESLWNIAGYYGVSIRDLKDWNGLSGDAIMHGGKLVVYHHKPKSINPNQRYKLTYRVKKGNYLVGIAQVFNLSIPAIRKWNRLTRGHIYPGQSLVLFVKTPMQRHSHKIKKGESLSQIAQVINVSIKHLTTVNGIAKPSVIRRGQTLVYYKS